MKHGLGRTPHFSVVVPTHDRRERLRMVLEALGRQVYPHDGLDFIVVCDGCTDGSAEMVRGLRLPFAVTVIEQANHGPAVARNAGLERARGPFVLFVDDDVIPAPYLAYEHARAHAGSESRVVIGPLLAPAQRLRPWVEWEGDKLAEQYRDMVAGKYKPTPYQFYTGNASLLLRLAQEAGGFDAGFRRGEDVELALRLQVAGAEFHFEPRAAAVHVADRPYKSWKRAAYDYGRNDVLFSARDTAHSLKRMSDMFEMRRPILQVALRASLQVPPLRTAITAGSGLVARTAPAVGARRLSQVACSLAFNIEYWAGIRHELGSRSQALALTRPWRERIGAVGVVGAGPKL